MQITSGINRGEKILSPVGLKIRPTSNKVRSAIFNILRFDIAEKNFLDLFAGTGAIGIQAISEGASLSCFVEMNFKCVNTIKANLLKLEFNSKSIIFKKKVEAFLEEENELLSKFDIVFMDPPYTYKYQQYFDIISKLLKYSKDNSIFIIEHSSNLELKSIVESFAFNDYKLKNYGDTNLSIFYRN
jgi:16S rRNA (guanine966-N2)-methyltransferase